MESSKFFIFGVPWRLQSVLLLPFIPSHSLPLTQPNFFSGNNLIYTFMGTYSKVDTRTEPIAFQDVSKFDIKRFGFPDVKYSESQEETEKVFGRRQFLPEHLGNNPAEDQLTDGWTCYGGVVLSAHGSHTPSGCTAILARLSGAWILVSELHRLPILSLTSCWPLGRTPSPHCNIVFVTHLTPPRPGEGDKLSCVLSQVSNTCLALDKS